jgi:hypothetical protein
MAPRPGPPQRHGRWPGERPAGRRSVRLAAGKMGHRGQARWTWQTVMIRSRAQQPYPVKNVIPHPHRPLPVGPGYRPGRRPGQRLATQGTQDREPGTDSEPAGGRIGGRPGYAVTCRGRNWLVVPVS